MRKLIADVHPGDTLMMPDGYHVLVERIEWLSYSPVVTINSEILFDKFDWVEVCA